MKTLIKDGTVFTCGRLKKADILIEDGKITYIGRAKQQADEVINALGLTVSPSFIDLHVHLREPGFESKETIRTGTMAAAAGGYTLVCAMPNLSPPPDSLDSLNIELQRIRDTAVIEVLPYGKITHDGISLSDMQALSPFVAGFSDDGKGVQSIELMRIAMKNAAEHGSLIAAHCEDESLLSGGCVHDGVYARLHGLKGISSASEYMQLRRDLELAQTTGCRYHMCHISCAESVAAIRRAKFDKVNVTCEITPHHALLCDMDMEDDGRFKMNPPLRDSSDQKVLVQAMQDGTIDVIATDHAPHTIEEKSKGLQASAMGVVGLETAFAVLYTGLVLKKELGLERLLTMMSTAPAKILGRSHDIDIGCPADITLLDLNTEYKIDPATFKSMGRSTPFSGNKVKGRVVRTILNGRTVFTF